MRSMRVMADSRCRSLLLVLVCCAVGITITPTQSAAAAPLSVGAPLGQTQPVPSAIPLGSGEPATCINVLLEPKATCLDGEEGPYIYHEVESWNSTGEGWGSCAEVTVAQEVRGSQCVGNISSGYDEVYCISKCSGKGGWATVENNSGGEHRFTLWASWE